MTTETSKKNKDGYGSIQDYYPNSLCIADKSKVELYNSWFDTEYTNFYISIEACNPKTYKGKDNNGVCRDESELKTFLGENIFYYITQDNIVNKAIY